MIRATYELEPPAAAEALARVTSTGIAADPGGARPVVEQQGALTTLSYPDENWGSPLRGQTLARRPLSSRRRCRTPRGGRR